MVIVTDHSTLDYGRVAERARLLVDTRNATKGVTGDHIVHLSGPQPFRRRRAEGAPAAAT